MLIRQYYAADKNIFFVIIFVYNKNVHHISQRRLLNIFLVSMAHFQLKRKLPVNFIMNKSQTKVTIQKPNKFNCEK